MSDIESKSRFFLFPDREHDVAKVRGLASTATSNDRIHSEDDSLHTQYHALTTQHGGRCIIHLSQIGNSFTVTFHIVQ